MNQNDETSPSEAVCNVAELAHDLVTLTGLQRRLFVADVAHAWQRVWPAMLVLLGGLILAASCIPLALVCIALLLVATTSMGYAAAFCCVLALGVLAAGGLSYGALRWLQSAASVFEPSRAEWGQNVDWLKSVLRRLSRHADDRVARRPIVRQ